MEAGWTTAERPGWTAILELATYFVGKARWKETDRRALRPPAVAEGRLQLRVEDPPPETAGLLAAAEVLSGETCEACGGKGDPVGNGRGQRTGCRCGGCRDAAAVRLPREWAAATVEDGPGVVSPGQWTADIRGGTSGADWDATDWLNYGRLETMYARPIAQRMQADDDEKAMRLWAGGTGWAGLIRALFVRLRSEQDERSEDAGHVPWRLRWMKEKFGTLRPADTAYAVPAGSGDVPGADEPLDLHPVREAGRDADAGLDPAGVRHVLGAVEARGGDVSELTRPPSVCGSHGGRRPSLTP